MKKLNLIFFTFLLTGITFAQYISDYTGAEIDAGVRPYKIYSVLLTQTDTNAPVATVLENTLGSAVWARATEGHYTVTFTQNFISAQTTVQLSIIPSNEDYIFFYNYSIADNFIYVNTIRLFNDGGEVSNLFSDGLLADTPFEIRVYAQ